MKYYNTKSQTQTPKGFAEASSKACKNSTPM